MTGARILVTGIGGPAGRALARQLAVLGVPFVGTDMTSVSLPGARIHRVPPAADPSLPAVLRELALREHITVMIPTVSEELPVLAPLRDTFGVTRVLISAEGPVAAADDKFTTASALAAQKVPVPRFALPSAFSDSAAALAWFGGPFVVKPRVSRGGRGVRVVREPDGIDWAAVTDTCILQEFLPGTEYGPMVYRPADGVARRETVVVVEKLALAHGEVGNAVTVRRLPPGACEDVACAARMATAALGLRGPADVDVRRGADGLARVLEVNARFGANSDHAPELLRHALAESTGDRWPGEGRDVRSAYPDAGVPIALGHHV